MKKIYLGLLLSVLACNSWSNTVIEAQNAQGQTQRIYISDDYARMEVIEEQKTSPSYRLIDLKAHKVYIVNPTEKRYIDPSLTRFNPQPQQARPNTMYQRQPQQPLPPIRAELVKIEGDTIEIAGYPTVHYQVKVNGETCSDEYFSQSAAAIVAIAQFDKTMQVVKKQRDTQKSPHQHPCIQAYQQLDAQMQALGMRMKSVYATGEMKGKIRSEVVSIKTDEKVADDFYSLEGFAPLTMQEMQQMMQQRHR